MDNTMSSSATTPPRTLSGLHLDPLLPLTGGMDADQRLTLIARAGLSDYLTAHPTIGFAWIEDLAPVAVVIDLAAVPFIDSVVLGWLLRLSRAMPHLSLTLVGLSPRLRAQLSMLRLQHLLPHDE